MNNWIVISIAAGLAAAAMSASVIVPSFVSFFLFYLAAIPLFMAGLGWGPVAAGLAGIIASVALAVGLGPLPGLFFVLSGALAPVLLSRLALINRPAQGSAPSEGEAADQGLEWYPEGRLVLWCAGLAIALMCVTVLITGPDAQSFQETVSKQAEAVFAELVSQMPDLDKEQAASMVKAFVVLLPPAAASMWFLTTLFNMWAASRLLKIGDRSLRPWAPFHRLSFPRSSIIALGLAALLAFAPGLIGIAGTVAFAVLTCAFTLLGLAVVHSLTLGNPARGFMLGSLYALLVVMGWILVIPLCGMAIMDMYLNMRTRAAAARKPNND